MVDFFSIAQSYKKDYSSREIQYRQALENKRRQARERAATAVGFLKDCVLPQLQAARTALGHHQIIGIINTTLETDNVSAQQPCIAFKCAFPSQPPVETTSVFFESDGLVLLVGMGEGVFDTGPKHRLAEISILGDPAKVAAKLEAVLQRCAETLLKHLYDAMTQTWPKE